MSYKIKLTNQQNKHGAGIKATANLKNLNFVQGGVKMGGA